MSRLHPGAMTLPELESLYWRDEPARLDPDCRKAVERAAEAVARAAAGTQPIYGINTGFGKLASMRIAPEDTLALQRNLVRSHCSGVGPATPARIVRLMMSLKLLSFGRGASGVRWELVELLQNLLVRQVTPIIPAQGSVGASGDLAPLAHMAAVLMGEGEAEFGGQRMPGAAALEQAGLAPVVLAPKEGLALLNGTQFACAHALAGCFAGWRAVGNALLASALTTDAVMGSPAPFRPEIHALRGHRGQAETAKVLRRLLAGSEIRDSHRHGDSRVQDPYCIRCQPQILGAAVDLLRQAGETLEIEANGVTDNPLVLEDGSIVSGGNFHGESVAFAADQIALALAEVGAVSQRRIALMVDPALSHGLPPFLATNPGLNSGYMLAEVASAALMSENKQRANPCSTDSIPTSANQEDFVSMAAHAARRLGEINDNLARILAIEYLCAAQGVECRAPLQTSSTLQKVIARLREEVPRLEADRPPAPDIEKLAELVCDGTLTATAGDAGFPGPDGRAEGGI